MRWSIGRGGYIITYISPNITIISSWWSAANAIKASLLCLAMATARAFNSFKRTVVVASPMPLFLVHDLSLNFASCGIKTHLDAPVITTTGLSISCGSAIGISDEIGLSPELWMYWSTLKVASEIKADQFNRCFDLAVTAPTTPFYTERKSKMLRNALTTVGRHPTITSRALSPLIAQVSAVLW